jgi:ATP-binding cassette, subfamily B, bacterial MsbA
MNEGVQLGEDLDSDQEDRARSLDLLIRLLRETVRNYMPSYGLAIFSMALVAGSTAALAWLMKHAINDVFVDRNMSSMWLLAAAIIVLSCIKGGADYVEKVTLVRVGNAIVAQLQRRLFDKMLSLRMEYFTKAHSSKLIARISNNARAANNAVQTVFSTAGNLMTLIGLGAVMFFQDPLLTLCVIAFGPPIVYSISRMVRKAKEFSSAEFEGMAKVIASTQETFLGISAVKSFNLEGPMRAGFDEAISGVEAKSNAIGKLRALTSPVMELMGGVIIALMVLYAGWQTIAIGKTPGEFMSFITAFLLAYEPAKRLAGTQVTLQRNLNGVRKMYALLDLDMQEKEVNDCLELKSVRGDIEFSKVKFGYVRKPVLDDFSLRVKTGELVALVGRSGAGKSTVFSLLQRFFTPCQGEIRIDGINIVRLPLSELRRQIAVVSQDTVLFSGTLADNIRLGRLDATADEVIAAAKAASIDHFISSLPKGFETPVGERGITLSGGQAQRLAIARAILKNAPILLLDEATSALDTETENDIRTALERLMRGKTTIVIAHRFSTIANADRIYVLESGQIVGCGTHTQLIRSNQTYINLFGDKEIFSDIPR